MLREHIYYCESYNNLDETVRESRLESLTSRLDFAIIIITTYKSRLDMEYDYEFMWDYEISVHDDLDENMHTQYAELDENYARRESNNFQTLAYMHYAC